MNSKINNTEVVLNLLEKIIIDSTGDNTPLPEVLRLCMRLSTLLKNGELLKWALSELNGYKDSKDLPDYRVQSTSVQGHFSGPFGSGLRNAHIPQSVIDKKHRESLFTNYFMDPVAELESLTYGNSNKQLHSFWAADVIAFYQRRPIYEGDMVLSSAWRTVTQASIKGILDTVRTRVLEFALKIECEIKGEVSDNKTLKIQLKTPSQDKITQIISNTIYAGNVSVGNLGETTQQNVQINPGDIKGMKKYLQELGITIKLIDELEIALAQDENSRSQPGPATSSWISRVMIMIGRGTLNVTSNAAGSMIASVIMQYLGLSS